LDSPQRNDGVVGSGLAFEGDQTVGVVSTGVEVGVPGRGVVAEDDLAADSERIARSRMILAVAAFERS